MIWIPFWAGGVINGIGHYWGYRKAQRLARREAVLLSKADRKRLTEVLEQSGALTTVYPFKLRLHKIWE